MQLFLSYQIDCRVKLHNIAVPKSFDCLLSDQQSECYQNLVRFFFTILKTVLGFILLPLMHLQKKLHTIHKQNSKSIKLLSFCLDKVTGLDLFSVSQALLVSEHEISPASTCFHAAMSQLLDLCESSEKSSISKIHALNILRSLFRSTELGDQVNSYVARGVKIAVLGFNASSWSVSFFKCDYQQSISWKFKKKNHVRISLML